MDEFEFFKGWNGWVLDTKRLVLMSPGDWHYEIDLEQCTNSAKVLDWIIQLSKKTWVTPEVFSGLVRALDDTLVIQGTFCPGGASKNIESCDIERLVTTCIGLAVKKYAYG
jgi:hypothetical protein